MKEWLIQRKKIVAAAVVLLCLSAGAWYSFAGRILGVLQTGLVQRVAEQINGRLQVGDVDISVFGTVKVRDAAVYDAKGTLLAQSPAIKIRYQWSDLTGGRIGLPEVQTVTLEGVEIWLREENGRLNWEGLLKEKQGENEDFRGNIQLEKSRIHIETSLFSRDIEGVSGSLEYMAYPDVRISLQGKLNETSVSIGGQWGEGRPGELTIRSGEIDAAKLSDLLGDTEKKLKAGKLQKLALTVKRDEKGAVRFQTDGEFSEVNIAGKTPIQSGQGKFSGDQNGLDFRELSMNISGQPAQGQGRIVWQQGKGTLDFTLVLPDVDPQAFVAGLNVQRPFSIKARISGQVNEPDIAGSFSIPQVALSDMAISGVTGSFHFNDSTLILDAMNGSAYQGRLNAAGEILTGSESYELEVAGQGMDSSRLTDKDVRGPLAFTGHVSGKGQDAVTRGSFIINDGKAYGISFQAMTGNFVKRGASTEISGIAVQTAFGTFYPEQLTQEAMERINRQELPVSQDELKKAVTDKIIQRLLR